MHRQTLIYISLVSDNAPFVENCSGATETLWLRGLLLCIFYLSKLCGGWSRQFNVIYYQPPPHCQLYDSAPRTGDKSLECLLIDRQCCIVGHFTRVINQQAGLLHCIFSEQRQVVVINTNLCQR